MKKSQKKQQFKGGDAASVLGVLSLVCYIVIYILGNNTGDKELQTAQLEMESLSAQLMAAGMKTLPAQSRGIASAGGSAVKWVQNWDNVGPEGKIGKDPWGQPFHYIVVKKSSGHAEYIVLISGGPNSRLETPVEKITVKDLQARSTLRYVGDDFGLVRVLP